MDLEVILINREGPLNRGWVKFLSADITQQ